MVLPLPVLFFPAIGNFVLEKLRLWPKNVAAGKCIELGLCICSLTFALPMSIALFEQRAMLHREEIDDEFKYIIEHQDDDAKFKELPLDKSIAAPKTRMALEAEEAEKKKKKQEAPSEAVDDGDVSKYV